MSEGVGSFGRKLTGADVIDGAMALNQLAQRTGLDQFHGDVKVPLVTADGVELHDVGMRDCRSELRLTSEPTDEARTAENRGKSAAEAGEEVLQHAHVGAAQAVPLA